MINPKDPHSTSDRFSIRHELPSIAMRKSYVRDLLDWRKDANRLQKVSSETEETSEAGTGHGESLVGTGSWNDGWGWGSRGSDRGGTDGSAWGRGWDDWCWSGSVGVDWCAWGIGWDNWATWGRDSWGTWCRDSWDTWGTGVAVH